MRPRGPGCAAPRPRLELAEILRRHAHELAPLSRAQQRVVEALMACRTAALGGHLYRCDRCGHEQPLFNSCRNRHCPKCQGLEAARWVCAQAQDLLPVRYFHLVFTVPASLHPLFRIHCELAFALLFAAASRTLLELARSRLGASLGITAVLHTWSQTLAYHPHVHCIVTGGGLSVDGPGWVHSRPSFLLPVRVLSQVFRGKLLSSFQQALAERRLGMSKATGRQLLERAACTPWVVYSKAPLAGPEQVLRYLGRYTHRIAIGNERLLSLREGEVSFRYRDRTTEGCGRQRIMRLDARDFLRRFLQHVLPRRFVRIRHYGLHANAFKSRRLAQARQALQVPAPPPSTRDEHWQDAYLRLVGTPPLVCPACRVGVLVALVELRPVLESPLPRAP